VQIRDLFNNSASLRQLLRQHLIAYTLTLANLTNTADFYMLQGSPATLYYEVIAKLQAF